VNLAKHPIAAALYEEYCRAVGGFAFNGDPLPSWQKFRDDPSKLKQSDAWIAVAEKAREVIPAMPFGSQ
jgi:hypothetical protein